MKEKAEWRKERIRVKYERERMKKGRIKEKMSAISTSLNEFLNKKLI